MITIYADGACRNNQCRENIGAWAYRLECDNGAMKENCAAVHNTTNNIMELTAVIEALKALKPAAATHQICVICDSQYVVKGVNEWSANWQVKRFVGVKNAELWQELLHLRNQFPSISFTHTKGHAGDRGNEQVDFLCNKIMDLEEKK